uniref:Uncharacterized protein n=1 Tax=Sphaerodactylus townsendi TaxID=933632 RepID=A0ACB8EBM7_9SAUR
MWISSENLVTLPNNDVGGAEDDKAAAALSSSASLNPAHIVFRAIRGQGYVTHEGHPEEVLSPSAISTPYVSACQAE